MAGFYSLVQLETKNVEAGLARLNVFGFIQIIFY